ncbi:AtpZ/AtpI family protein [Arthrobacter roseus]|uniref:AtpZ/AtpI family protein n=1 Tax=Arthrobacter roseus TaxID=136274 RepID=UPI001EF7DAFE|nr:AtpZ/AtpI family protein [Arthrobacter roseus]MBM7849017.1 F0F1-type ATP synthase assembly protein I [Arthrobacter roseus]
MSKSSRQRPRNGEIDAPLSNDTSSGGYNAGLAVFSYVVGGILVWSLIGWGLDSLLGTGWIVLAGALVGVAGGFYLSAMHNLFRARDQDDGPKHPKATE